MHKVIKSIQLIFLSVLSGVLLHFAWPNSAVFPLLFVGFVPLLFALKRLSISTKKYTYFKSFFLIIITYVVWTSFSLGWLRKTALDTHVLAILLNPINYALGLALFPMIYKTLGKKYALIYFASVILFVDWISQISMFSTPYFNLGLGLGKTPWLIQHYKWIGVEGGSLWIIATNLFTFKFISEKKYTLKKMMPLSFLVIIIPLISLISYYLPVEKSLKTSIVTIHHSCYNPNTKKRFEYPQKVIDKLFKSTFLNITDTPSVVLWPETSIIRLGWIHKIDSEPVILYLKSKLKNYPSTTVIFGAIGFSYVENEKDITAYTSFSESGNYYNTHNLAVSVSYGKKTRLRGKEIFIPFHERIPYLNRLPFLSSLVSQVGTRTVFSPIENKNTIINDSRGNSYEAVLCYESLFPLFMSKKSTDNVGAIIILTNEHWLKNISASQQYLYENVAMAIQGGKPILRSSNCGISAIINQKGDIVVSEKEQRNKSITTRVELKYKTTFYSKIKGLFHALGGILFALILFLFLTKKNKFFS